MSGTAGRGRWRAVLAGAAMAAGLTAGAVAQTPDDALAQSALGAVTAQRVDVDGVQARYYEAGEGAPLLLLHGGRLTVFNSANMWTRNVEGLAESFRVLAVDRYGFGMTGTDGGDDFSYEREVAFLAEFLDAMDVESAHIAGNSSGAAVALRFAMTHPERVRTLALVAVGPHTLAFDEGAPKANSMREACNGVDNAALSWSCWMKAMTDQDDAFEEGFLPASQAMMARPEWVAIDAVKRAHRPLDTAAYWAEQYAGLTETGVLADMPVLILCGRRDTLDWPAGARTPMATRCMGLLDTLGRSVADVSLLVYDRAGHFPYRELPERFNADLVHFAAGR